MKYYVEKCPVVAPGVIDVYNNGVFESRWYQGQEYDENGDPVYDTDSDDDDDD